MFSARKFALSTVVAFSLASPAFAADSAVPYVTSKMLDLSVLIPPPPVTGSPEDLADVKAAFEAQSHASDARKAQAAADADEAVYTMFGNVLGAKFNEASLPKTTALFARVGKSEGRTLDPAKDAFKRIRPFIAHPEILPIAKPSKSFSYPSGHTTHVALAASVLAQMVPEKKREIWLRAEDYGQSRIIGGAHYPTDVAVSWRTGAAIAAVMQGLPEFQHDLAEATAELRGVMGLPAK
jgi:acid phosphatase (class A)